MSCRVKKMRVFSNGKSRRKQHKTMNNLDKYVVGYRADHQVASGTIIGLKEFRTQPQIRRQRRAICIKYHLCAPVLKFLVVLPKHCVSVPACVQILSRFCQSGVCSSFASISLLEQSSTGSLAGWLASQERKQSLSNSRWRTACAYTAEAHTYTHTQTPIYKDT